MLTILILLTTAYQLFQTTKFLIHRSWLVTVTLKFLFVAVKSNLEQLYTPELLCSQLKNTAPTTTRISEHLALLVHRYLYFGRPVVFAILASFSKSWKLHSPRSDSCNFSFWQTHSCQIELETARLPIQIIQIIEFQETVLIIYEISAQFTSLDPRLPSFPRIPILARDYIEHSTGAKRLFSWLEPITGHSRKEIWNARADNVPVKSKLQHPPGQPPWHLNFWNFFFKFPPHRPE